MIKIAHNKVRIYKKAFHAAKLQNADHFLTRVTSELFFCNSYLLIAITKKKFKTVFSFSLPFFLASTKKNTH